jgi:hypothetical protein
MAMFIQVSMTRSFYFCVCVRNPCGSLIAYKAKYEGKSNKPATPGVLQAGRVFESVFFRRFCPAELMKYAMRAIQGGVIDKTQAASTNENSAAKPSAPGAKRPSSRLRGVSA